MNLPNGTANSGPVIADHHKEVLSNESHFLIGQHNLYVRESLPVGTNLILAFHNQNATFPQDAIRFPARIYVQGEYGLVVSCFGWIARTIVAIVFFKRCVCRMRSSSWRVHVRRIKHHAVNAIVFIGHFSAVNTSLDVSSQNFVTLKRDVSPECALPVSHIRNPASRGNVKLQNPWKHPPIAICVGGYNEIVGRLPIADNPGSLCSTGFHFTIYQFKVLKLFAVSVYHCPYILLPTKSMNALLKGDSSQRPSLVARPLPIVARENP